MKKIAVIFMACSSLLAGCWDEQLYKDIAIVPIVGFEGEPEKLTGHYVFSAVSNETISFSVIDGDGISMRDTRLDANRKTSEVLDLSQLQVILFATETAMTNIEKTLDASFRTPRNRLSSKIAIVEGEMASYMEKTEKMAVELPDYYNDILKTDIAFSIIPDADIQRTARLLIDDAIDLSLPFLKISENSGVPEVAGIALFSDNVFTGRTLDKDESKIVQVLRKETGNFTMFTYMWEKEGKTYPITVDLVKYNKKWDIQDSKIDATYKMKFSVEEFAYDHLDEDKTRKELEKFLSKELTKDFNKVIKKLQEAKSDAVGFGRTVRAFHPKLWKSGKWNDTFAELDINIKVEVKITRTGIVN